MATATATAAGRRGRGGEPWGAASPRCSPRPGRPVLLLDPIEAALKKGLGVIEKSLGRLVEQGHDRRPRRAKRSLRRIVTQGGRISARRVRDRRRGGARALRPQESGLSDAGPEAAARRDPRHEHLLDLGDRAGGLDQAARALRRDALHESGSAHAAASRSSAASRRSDETVAETADLAQALGKIPVVVADRPGFVSNRVLMPMINEAAFTPHGGRRRPRSDRYRHEAGHESSDGAAGARRPHRHRRLPRHHGSPARRIRGLQVPALPRCCAPMVAAGRLGRKSGRGFYEYP